MSRADRAEELFKMGYNCCQSVFGAFNDVTGLELDKAVMIASPFGAGLGKLREVCGAVSGMCMVAGYTDPKNMEDKKEVYKLIQDMCNEFKSIQGSYICREILKLRAGEDSPEPAVRDENYYKSRSCVGACRLAAEIAEKYLLN